MKWPDGKELNNKQIKNFRCAYSIYETLYEKYRDQPPKGVDEEYYKNKVISAFGPQVYFNLPQRKEVLYTGLISKKSLTIGEKRREHRYPRKVWVKWRLFDIGSPVTFEEFFSLYCDEGGSYNHTTNKENRALPAWYNKQPEEAIHDGGKAAYEACGIILVEDPEFTKR